MRDGKYEGKNAGGYKGKNAGGYKGKNVTKVRRDDINWNQSGNHNGASTSKQKKLCSNAQYKKIWYSTAGGYCGKKHQKVAEDELVWKSHGKQTKVAEVTHKKQVRKALLSADDLVVDAAADMLRMGWKLRQHKEWISV